MKSDVNLKLLRTFDAVARHGSFTRAAAELGRTQSTVSNQLRELEQQLGAPLLDRTSRRIKLTKAGRALVVPLSEGLRLILEGLAAVKGVADERQSRVLIACVPSLSVVLLPRVLSTYQTRDKATRIDVSEITSGEIIAAMGDDALDFGVGPCSSPLPAGVSFTPAVEEPLIVLLRRADAAGLSHSISFVVLATLPLVTLSGSVLLQRQLHEAADRHGIQLHSRTEVRHVHTAIGMARAGIGAAIVPRLALPEVLDTDIVALPLMDPPLVRKVGIIARQGVTLRPEAGRLARYIRSALARSGADSNAS